MFATPVILKEGKIHHGVKSVNFKKRFVKDQKKDNYCLEEGALGSYWFIPLRFE